MSLKEDIYSYCLSTVRNPFFQQLAPFAVLFILPIFILFGVQAARNCTLLWSAAMVLENLGISLVLPWNWSGNSVHEASGSHEKKKSQKKHVRTRADQMSATSNGHTGPQSTAKDVDDGYYPGLVNISGTYCFMNSTLQAMASLSYLQPHIDAIHAKAVALDVPSPVVDALQDLMQELNTPNSFPSSLRPLEIIQALSNHSPFGGKSKINSLFSSREHQDAQELFQLLSECIKDESAAIDREGYRDRGLSLGVIGGSEPIGKSVFDGLTANRRSCVECGYTEAVMHFGFDNWQLAVPRMAAACDLETCLADYTRLELLTDCICRKCSLVATHKRLAQEAAKLAESLASDPNPSTSKKKRAKEAKRLEMKVQSALDEGRIEDDIKGVKMDKVFSKASTKQAMIARPPPVLALHLNRSMHYGQYAIKNNVRIAFSEILDLTSFTTSGNLSTVPSIPISTPPPDIPRSTTPTPAHYAIPRTIYRLSAVVCHYGQHSFGHYVCYRRKPRPPSSGDARFAPPKLVDPLGCECDKCERFGPVRDDDDTFNAERCRPGHGWLRISDDSVKEVGIETVLQEGSGVFMLYYERVMSRPGIYPTNSEETLKPVSLGLVPQANMSVSSLASVGNGSLLHSMDERKPRVLGPRVVRSVAPSRGRSLSAAPSERDSLISGASGSTNSSNTPKARSPTPVNGDARLAASVIVNPTVSLNHDASLLSSSMPNLLLKPNPAPSEPETKPPAAKTSPISDSHDVQSPQPVHPSQSRTVGLTV